MDANTAIAYIAEEKAAFVKAEYGHLQSIMGATYTDGDETRVFHPYPGYDSPERPLGNPDELTLTELAELPFLVKRIPRLGTVSDMPLIRFMPEDRDRIVLLDRIDQAFVVGAEPAEDDLAQLESGHAAYLASKAQDDGPVIIR